MRIAVLGGGGAMGGLFGGRLADAGHDVVLIDMSAPAVEAISRDGLTIEEKDGTVRRVRVPATSDPASVGTVVKRPPANEIGDDGTPRPDTRTGA